MYSQCHLGGYTRLEWTSFYTCLLAPPHISRAVRINISKSCQYSYSYAYEKTSDVFRGYVVSVHKFGTNSPDPCITQVVYVLSRAVSFLVSIELCFLTLYLQSMNCNLNVLPNKSYRSDKMVDHPVQRLWTSFKCEHSLQSFFYHLYSLTYPHCQTHIRLVSTDVLEVLLPALDPSVLNVEDFSDVNIRAHYQNHCIPS